MSLKEISEALGVSIATVSRVLNQPEYRCREKGMTEKIREYARTMHYIPDANARQLKINAGKETNEASTPFCVDVLLARFDTIDADLFFQEVFRYLETELLHQGCCMGEILNVPDISVRKMNRQRSSAEGLVILGKCPSSLIVDLKKEYSSMIAIDRNPTEYEVDEVVCNGARAAGIAMEYLIEIGHHKIGYIGDCNMESRYTGYYDVLLQHKIPLTYDYVVPTTQTMSEGAHAYDVLLAKEKRPTAVLCANDATAIGFIQRMQEKIGKRKKNVYRPAVIAIDDVEMATQIRPMLTTVHIPKKDLAHLAITMLKDRQQAGHKEFLRLELPCHLMVRESCSAVWR